MIDRAKLYPIGASVVPEDLARDPYPVYARMQALEPISWVAGLNMYYVVRYDHVHAILTDPLRFAVGTEHSTLFDTFGAHMLTVDDERHERYRAAFQPSLAPSALRLEVEQRILENVDCLIDGFETRNQVELRRAFASRLPIMTMLSLFGVPLEREAAVRGWYDSFEAALANFQWKSEVRQSARRNVAAFRSMIQESVDRYRHTPNPAVLLGKLASASPEARLEDEAIQRNALIVFFGGISTVEALILNAIHALGTHPEALDQLRTNRGAIPAILDETIRWSGPVQSATRHVLRDTVFAGIELHAGETVNCMIAAANRDPAKFADPERFDIARHGLRQHLGFAVGPHHCVGSHLAKLEARIALDRLCTRLPGWRVDWERSTEPYGGEFRKPQQLSLMWD
jgi:cytochrome P450